MNNKNDAFPLNSAWNTKCDIHGWWVKTALTKACPFCKDEFSTLDYKSL